MIKFEDQCVGCPQGCINCGRKRTPIMICDDCGEEVEDLYEVGNQQLCGECALNNLDKVPWPERGEYE